MHVRRVITWLCRTATRLLVDFKCSTNTQHSVRLRRKSTLCTLSKPPSPIKQKKQEPSKVYYRCLKAMYL